MCPRQRQERNQLHLKPQLQPHPAQSLDEMASMDERVIERFRKIAWQLSFLEFLELRCTFMHSPRRFWTICVRTAWNSGRRAPVLNSWSLGYVSWFYGTGGFYLHCLLLVQKARMYIFLHPNPVQRGINLKVRALPIHTTPSLFCLVAQWYLYLHLRWMIRRGVNCWSANFKELHSSV